MYLIEQDHLRPIPFPLPWTRPSPDPPRVWESSISFRFSSLSFITPTPSCLQRGSTKKQTRMIKRLPRSNYTLTKNSNLEMTIMIFLVKDILKLVGWVWGRTFPNFLIFSLTRTESGSPESRFFGVYNSWLSVLITYQAYDWHSSYFSKGSELVSYLVSQSVGLVQNLCCFTLCSDPHMPSDLNTGFSSEMSLNALESGPVILPSPAFQR